MIDIKTKKLLKTLWDYMVLNMPIEKCDLIIGCGCDNLDVPIRCSELLKEGYANKILFTGGLGKITSNNKEFETSEAEVYKKIAIENGIQEKDIIIETESQNTGDNFRNSIEIINKLNIKADKILIVHNNLSERRTLNTAKKVLPTKRLIITSISKTFDEFIEDLNSYDIEKVNNIISVVVGDIQRIIIYPQFGWHVKDIVPKKVISAYKELKKLGYDKFICNKAQIDKTIKLYDLKINEPINYFN